MKKLYILLGLAVFIFATSAAAIYLNNEKYEDPLCAFAKGAGMQCLTMASPKLYERGAVLHEVQTKDKPDVALTLPTEYLLSDACVLPGTDVEFAKFHDDPDRQVAFPNQSISISKSLFGSASGSSRQLGGIKFSLGPKAQSSVDIDVASEGVSLFNIETAPFIDSLKSCSIRAACANRVKNGDVRIVKQLLVAKNLTVNVQEDRGISYPLSAAVGNGLVKADFGANSSVKLDNKMPDRGDIAFGARLFDPKELADIEVCHNDLTILDFTTTTKFAAHIQPRLNGAPMVSSELKDVDDAAKVKYTAPDRGVYEGMLSAETWAGGKAMVDQSALKVEFIHVFTTIPGTRWDNREMAAEDGMERGPVYAASYADAQSEVTLKLANRSNDSKVLAMYVSDKTDTSISLLGSVGQLSAYFSPLTLTRSNGKDVSLNAVWNSGVTGKRFALGPLAPGEAVGLKIGYESSRKAEFTQDGGSARVIVSATFALE